MNDKLKELLQSPSLPSIRLGWVMGKGMGVGVEEMASIIIRKCTLGEHGILDYSIFFGCNVDNLTITNQPINKKPSIQILEGDYLFEVLCQYHLPSIDLITFEQIEKLVLSTIIKHFENE